MYKFPPPHVCIGVILFFQCWNGKLSVQVRSAVLFMVSFGSSCSLECMSAASLLCLHSLGWQLCCCPLGFRKYLLQFFTVSLTAPCGNLVTLVKKEFSVLKLNVFYCIFCSTKQMFSALMSQGQVLNQE